MVINILAFGVAKEIMGGNTVTMVVPDGITASGFMAYITGRYPGMAALTSFAIAINGNYVSQDTIITQTDEVAIIPPVSGG